MRNMATITSKRQLTIPAHVFTALNLRAGEKVLIFSENETIKIIPALRLINRLAGSVTIPKRFQGLTMEELVEKAKKEHFQK